MTRSDERIERAYERMHHDTSQPLRLNRKYHTAIGLIADTYGEPFGAVEIIQRLPEDTPHRSAIVYPLLMRLAIKGLLNSQTVGDTERLLYEVNEDGQIALHNILPTRKEERVDSIKKSVGSLASRFGLRS